LFLGPFMSCFRCHAHRFGELMCPSPDFDTFIYSSSCCSSCQLCRNSFYRGFCWIRLYHCYVVPQLFCSLTYISAESMFSTLTNTTDLTKLFRKIQKWSN
jgi:hypothetical protein